MAKLIRKNFKQFGASGATSNFGQFGSKQAGVPQTSQDPTIIQQLTAWIDGWQNAISSGDKAPYLEDMNGWCFVVSYMIAYMFQSGIPEWDSTTTYFIGSVVQDAVSGGQQFRSLQDNNIGNVPPVSASNAFWSWINPPIATIPVVGNSLKANLSLAPNNGAPSTKTDISADLLSVQGVSLSTVSLTADITVSGANGLDTGAPANNTWYAVHVITNAAGSLVASLYSLSATAPTMPGSYTLFRRVGWVRRDGSGNFRQFTKMGDWTLFKATSSYSSPTGTTSFAADVPSTSQMAQFFTEFVGVTSSGQNWGSLTFTATGTTAAADVPAASLTNSTQRASMVFQFSTNASQQIDISTNNLGSAPWTVNVMGYYDPV